MDAEYSQKRDESLPFRYRFRVRALMAVKSYRNFDPENESPDVLELGAADGRTLLVMREYFDGRGSYTGVELSEALLDRASDLPGNTRVIEGDVTSLPDSLQVASFDLCCALALLEHLSDPIACVTESYRMLRPGGVFVASSPSPFWDRVAGKLGLIDDGFHQQEVTPSDMISWAETAGFETITTRPFMWCVTGAFPYLGFMIEPESSLQIDSLAEKIDPMSLSFVNQALVARKGR